MLIYSLLICIILLFRQVVSFTSRSKTSYKIENELVYVLCVILVILAAFRGEKVGTDTLGYIADYNNLSYFSFSDLADRYEGYLGFYYISKIFSIMSFPMQVWFGVIELFYVYSMYKFIQRFSQDKLYSFLIFVTCGLFVFSMAGMKQVLSMSFMMLSFLYFVDKKYIKTVLLAVMAYLCHPAGLIMLVGYLLYILRDFKYYYACLTIAILLAYVSGKVVLSNMVSFLGNEHFEMYLNFENTYSSVTLIFYAMITAMALFGIKQYSKHRRDEAKIALGFSIVACGLQSLALISPSTFRLAYLYTPFFMILIPNATRFVKPHYRQIVYSITVFSLIFFFLYTNRNTPYNFI